MSKKRKAKVRASNSSSQTKLCEEDVQKIAEAVSAALAEGTLKKTKDKTTKGKPRQPVHRAIWLAFVAFPKTVNASGFISDFLEIVTSLLFIVFSIVMYTVSLAIFHFFGVYALDLLSNGFSFPSFSQMLLSLVLSISFFLSGRFLRRELVKTKDYASGAALMSLVLAIVSIYISVSAKS